MKSVFIGDFLISAFSLFFQKPINDFFNYEEKLILAVLKETAQELGPRKASNFAEASMDRSPRGKSA
jgi:hypothetical protein